MADLLGCPEGRSSPQWIDFDFYGHQIVAHLAPDECGHRSTNEVDGERTGASFRRHPADGGLGGAGHPVEGGAHRFVIEPQVRFKGQVGEQATMFFHRPQRQRARVQGVRRTQPGLSQVRIQERP